MQEGGVPQISHAELLRSLDRLPVPGTQIVHHDHLIALFDQQYRHVAADISGTASHQNGFHTRVLILSYTLNKP